MWFLSQIDYPAPTARYFYCRIPSVHQGKIGRITAYFKLKNAHGKKTEDFTHKEIYNCTLCLLFNSKEQSSNRTRQE